MKEEVVDTNAEWCAFKQLQVWAREIELFSDCKEAL